MGRGKTERDPVERGLLNLLTVDFRQRGDLHVASTRSADALVSASDRSPTFFSRLASRV